MRITFRKLENDKEEFIQLYKWCQNKFVYEWFEQRKLSLKEIQNKYTKKLIDKKQNLLIIQVNDIDIGLIQIYRYEEDLNIRILEELNNIYEFDIFIGEEEYLSKGLGTIIINMINERIFSNYKADAIILRPFKRNIRAIKCYQKCNYEIIDEYIGEDTLGNKEEIVVLLNRKEQI